MKIIVQLFLASLLSISLSAKTVEYTFNITEIKEKVNGKQLIFYQINNSSPGPIIRANIGDVLQITVNNQTNINTIIHWHGLILNNNQDGVAEVTQPIIKSKTSYTYEIPVKQTGTYWYHAHGIEEAQGIFGGIVLSEEGASNIQEEVLLYSGILKDDPKRVLAALAKKDVKDIAGHEHMKAKKHKHNVAENIDHSNHDMMDMKMTNMKHFSDVSYAKNLINNQQSVLKLNTSGEKIKLRIINAYVDGYLNFVYSGGDITIISADGLPVEPIKVKSLKVAMGETYDVVLDVPSNNSYELVSFFMGEQEYSKVIIGQGKLKPITSYDVSKYLYESPYKKLKTITPYFIELANKSVDKNLTLGLKGDHDQYNWHIIQGSKQIDSLNLKTGDKLRVKITNNSMMPHPMHLHGFFFKVVSNPNNLIKHTYNLEHMESVEIEFVAEREGRWLFHCHNLFHMLSGMSMEFAAVK